MIPSTELENGKVELIREILDISDIHDIDLLKEYNKELADSLTQELTPDAGKTIKQIMHLSFKKVCELIGVFSFFSVS